MSPINVIATPFTTMSSNVDLMSDDSFSTRSDPLSPPKFSNSDHDDTSLGPQAVGPSTTPIMNRIDPLPPSSGPFRSSPIVGNAEERAAARKRKGQRKQTQTLQKKRAKRSEENEESKQANLEQILTFMNESDISLWDFLTYVFNPEHGQGRTRHHQFFSAHGRITQLLNWWTSSKNRSRMARSEIDEWAQEYIYKKITQEARAVTNSRVLQTMRRNLNAGLVNSFRFASIYNLLKDELAPISIRILESLTTSWKAYLHRERRKERTRIVRASFPVILAFH
jgi:hypothetical protein